jgi:hypothetical protein
MSGTSLAFAWRELYSSITTDAIVAASIEAE